MAMLRGESKKPLAFYSPQAHARRGRFGKAHWRMPSVAVCETHDEAQLKLYGATIAKIRGRK